jgi:uncharacterized protein YigA (DUF484 family)
MSEAAPKREPAEAIAEVVKTYLRMNRKRLAQDGELLSLLLPERFEDGSVRDFQRFVIERLSAEIVSLKAERDAVKAKPNLNLGEGVRRHLLDLIDARSFSEAIAVGLNAAPGFGADVAAFCIESDGIAKTSTEGVRLIPEGTIEAVLGREASGAILSGGGDLLLGPGGTRCKSLAAFRLRIGRSTPGALFVLGAYTDNAFENDALESDLRYFARALERAIRAWLDLPKN